MSWPQNSFLDSILGEREPIQESGTAKRRPAGEFTAVGKGKKDLLSPGGAFRNGLQ